jgi:hypothetical protein
MKLYAGAVPAEDAVIQLQNGALMIIPVVPPNAGTQGFQPLALGPRFRGDDEFLRSEDFLTASFAGEAFNIVRRPEHPCFFSHPVLAGA